MTGPVVMLDGAQFRRAPGHWQILLAQRLCDEGIEVSYPLLPDLDDPDVDQWCKAFRRHIDPDTIVIAHGLSAHCWTRLAADGGPVPVARRVLLVAPPGPGRHPWADPTPDPDLTALRPLSVEPPTIVVARDDPWLGGHIPDAPADSGVRVITLPTGGHLNETSGLGTWAPAHHWALTGDWPTPHDDDEPDCTPGALTDVVGPGELAAVLARLHRPHGRRLGIAITPGVSTDATAQVATILTAAGVTPDRRMALIPPSPTREGLDTNEIAYFVDRYGHEYTTVVTTDIEVPDPASLHDPLIAAGCHLVRIPAIP
ncbi:alpha/beta hydrolase [Gordonia sp. NB41Y]|uniref:alpha/beta hydrolase n=1 Tax=Gordonia sp. NB41Y TaxID=875808 RepID=UPI0006B1F677|nr:alpha/beta hydrolase [Gordonia sp. NB41Y]WLP91600.1 alpha/beta hydrolase [Gordonia sp. NB41Y]